MRILTLALVFFLATTAAQAEDGSAAWLRYAPLTDPTPYRTLPGVIIPASNAPADQSAATELQRGLSSLLGRPFTITAAGPAIRLTQLPNAAPEDYEITATTKTLTLSGATPQARLYAVFHVLEEVAAHRPILSEHQSPATPIRWTDEWDNLNGTIERGYAGPSNFFAAGHVKQDLTRAGQYARLLASVGINGCNVNNVNADLDLLTPAHISEFARLAAAFRPWSVRLVLSIDLTSPQTVGGLSTFDPLDPTVIAWWQAKVDELYTAIPDFAGFTVKADSEGRKGPSQYGRSPADAANVLARALAPHHGVVLYRGFVYSNHLDWRDPKADRARAGVDNFRQYDGKFLPNVIVQIKEGPIDFQAREPVSPLFAAIPFTNTAIELQTAQEYTGQQRHMVFLPAMWKLVLDTNLHAGPKPTTVASIVEGRAFPRPIGSTRMGGFISVTNAGAEPNWLHHPMALANLYGFGKLAWNPAQPLPDILDTWTRLTWGNDPEVVRTVTALLANSWQNYVDYTGPNGMGTLTNILGPHFGPGIESAERNGWGQWFKGDKEGIGMDRTAAGSGYIQQYPPALAAQYESLSTCPDDLLLFFHHVPYTWRLHSGQTLIQSIYDTHYAGALAAARYVPAWQSLQSKIDPERYAQVLTLFTFQAGHAIVWRDNIDQWFHWISGIDDTQHRLTFPNRIEAESMTPVGYTPVTIDPAESASGGHAMICKVAQGCTLATKITQPAGTYNIAVAYYDLRTGVSRYTLSVNGKPVANWQADDQLPPAVVRPQLDGQTATRYTAHNIPLHPGDTLTLLGIPDLNLNTALSEDPAGRNPDAPATDSQRELAPVDYLQLGPPGPITPQ